MSLKQIINRGKILSKVINRELELPGEPMIYSVKYPVGQRTRGLQFFRNMKWRSILKTFFRSFFRTNTPVVVIVRFFVTPSETVNISPKNLRQESVPAVMSYELCDYTLSFLEMLHHVLFNSYRQVVKLDVVKFYSNKPRTLVKFMKWDEYVKLQNSDTDNTKAEGIGEDDKRESIQSKRARNGSSSKLCPKEVLAKAHASAERPPASDSAFCSAGTSKPSQRKKRTAKLPTTPEETRRRQLGEVSE